MAHLTGQGVEEVVQGGTGLAFVVYPEALAAMPGAPIFSVRLLSMQPCLLPPTTYHLLLATHYSLLATHYSPLTTFYFLPRCSSSRCYSASASTLSSPWSRLSWQRCTTSRRQLHPLLTPLTHPYTPLHTVTPLHPLYPLYPLHLPPPSQITLRKERLSALLCLLMLVCGVIFVTEQGVHWLEYLIPLLLAGLLCSSAVSSVYGEYDFPPGGVACGWALALVCCAPTPIVAWRALKPCRWLWRRLRRRGVGAPPRVGDAAAGSRRRSNTRSGAGSEMYAVRAGNLQGASKRSPPQTSL
eukprot:scaffold13600_cov59-Phaeocystis_antarctica.AAC.4